MDVVPSSPILFVLCVVSLCVLCTAQIHALNAHMCMLVYRYMCMHRCVIEYSMVLHNCMSLEFITKLLMVSAYMLSLLSSSLKMGM